MVRKLLDAAGRTLSIPQKKPAIAWLYIAWMLQKRIMLNGQNAAVPMCRRSVWNDPSYTPPTPGWGKSAEYGIAIAKPQAIAIGQMRDAAGEIMNVAIRDGSRAAIQAETDKQSAFMDELIEKTEKGIDFAGVLPAFAKKMTQKEQVIPIEAEGLN